METLTPTRKTLNCIQRNFGSLSEVFELLCPVREKDWLDGWDYEMVYSRSGLIEKGCIFTTTGDGGKKTLWYVTEHDPQAHVVEFVRCSGGEMVVRIAIALKQITHDQTKTTITYEYTALNRAAADFLENEVEEVFARNMARWEKAINHYLDTGTMLRDAY